jgi:hypothetical protein
MQRRETDLTGEHTKKRQQMAEREQGRSPVHFRGMLHIPFAGLKPKESPL